MTAKKLRILHVGNHTIPCVGGIENVIWQCAREQKKLGHDVGVLVFDTCTNGSKLPHAEEIEGVQMHRVSHRGPAFYRIPPIRETLRIAQNYDLIHVHGFGPWLDIFCLTKPFHYKIVVANTHGGFFHTPNRKGIKTLYRATMIPLVKHLIDFVCLDSKSDYKMVEPMTSKNAVMPDGIDLNKWNKLPFTKKENTHFITVGRISENKRVDRLIDAFEYVAKKLPKAQLSIVGEDWEGLRNSLQKRIDDKKLTKHVHLLGKVSDGQLIKLYGKANIMVSASQYEGFGITIIEGMSAGCVPCINSIPTFTEFVGTDRGVITDYSNAEQASAEMIKLATLPKSKIDALRKRCRAYAQTYAIEDFVKRQIELYEKLLKGLP